MKFVKKWLGCIVSAVAGILGLALSACPGMFTKNLTFKTTESTKAFKVLTDGDLYKMAKDAKVGSEFMLMKVFAIITLVISVLLIAYAVVMLLSNLNVIKLNNKILDMAGIALIALLLIAVIGPFISSLSYASAMTDALKELAAFIGKVKVSIGAYQPVMLAVGIVSAVAVGANVYLNKKAK